MNKKFVVLNNGIKMPTIGYGVFRMTNLDECEKCVIEAIKSGYKLIDTAAAYENETAVGNAIKKCGIPREELFITSKLWVTDTSYEKAKDGFYRSLKRLGLDYIDLYLIHQPYNDVFGAWRALEELYEEGLIKAIGVDNFKQDSLANFIYYNKIKPAVNMIECNVYFQRTDEKEYLDEKNILLEAWSPLKAGSNDVFDNPILQEIALKHHKSVAQIVIRWLLQRGIVPVIKSSNQDRIKENINVYDFELNIEEMIKISKLDTKTSTSQRTKGDEVENFLKNTTNFNV